MDEDSFQGESMMRISIRGLNIRVIQAHFPSSRGPEKSEIGDSEQTGTRNHLRPWGL